VSLPEEPLRFEADSTRIIQFVGSLLDNAAKYTPRGGEISVTGYCERGEVVLCVRDTGIGISPEMLPRVFDLFVQSEPFLARSEERFVISTEGRNLSQVPRICSG
jgi:signal transduction histidine kinase